MRMAALAMLALLLPARGWAWPWSPRPLPPAVKQEWNAHWRNRIYCLRGFWRGLDLKYSAGGRLLSHPQHSDWTLAWIRLISLGYTGKQLKINGDWIGLAHFGGPPRLSRYNLHHTRTIAIQLAGQTPTAGMLQRLRQRIFVQEGTEMATALPAVWRDFYENPEFFKPDEKKFKICAKNPSCPNHKIQDPQMLYDPNPNYNPIARAAGLQGQESFWATVGVDGKLHHLRIFKPLGLGLDEAAMGAMRKWRLRPARQGGKPVAVKAKISISFHLYNPNN